ncbi:hypothetical protein DSO57_1029917 [Entomophthora muscae]|uniref:Uncharacterized protein n=1 Tax=Entomophthora muscae TaxID=34485 RepID=A0ACC2RS19_9FUNG|nr:hypothetical protein DSO57_1029917 [Entomophthora muscae]
MDYQPGPDPGMADIPYDSPALPIPQSYNHSRAGMVILAILSLDKVIISNLGAYCPLAAGLLYLTLSSPFLYWALVTRYPDELNSPLVPWYMTASGHDRVIFLPSRESLALLILRRTPSRSLKFSPILE